MVALLLYFIGDLTIPDLKKKTYISYKQNKNKPKNIKEVKWERGIYVLNSFFFNDLILLNWKKKKCDKDKS